MGSLRSPTATRYCPFGAGKSRLIRQRLLVASAPSLTVVCVAKSVGNDKMHGLAAGATNEDALRFEAEGP